VSDGLQRSGQAVLDGVASRDSLLRAAEPTAGLRAYEHARLPVTADLVRHNRMGGPERVIDEVERRAPEGFARLGDVLDPAELDQFVGGYQRLSTR
jgi:5-methylphenazine-1-carboxylate 1-monooxygenase